MRCSRGKSGCGRRFTLVKAPHKYAKAPRCPFCRSTKLIDNNNDVIENTKRRKRRGTTCYCTGYPFPHQKGSLRFCTHHPEWGEEPSQEQLYEYETTLDTPRG